MSESKPKGNLTLLLIGMFGITQLHLGGYIGISELFMFICAPFMYYKNRALFARDGVNVLLWLVLLWAFGAVWSDLVFNWIPFLFFLKGVASPLVVLGTVIVIYPILRRNPGGLRWLVTGLALSFVISVFVFHTGASGGEEATAESASSYKLFWVNMASQWLGLPVRGWYMEMPVWVSVVLTVIVALFSLHSGGRSDFLIAASASVLIIIGRKNKSSMEWIRRNFLVFVVSLLAFGCVAKFTYTFAASSGWMGEKERTKYEQSQTGAKGGILGLIMSGRAEFFIGATAALDRPIVGHSSLPIDYAGYRRNFQLQYGTEDNVQLFLKTDPSMLLTIPAHSHIIHAWMTNGIFGLVFWAYILWLLFMTLKRRMAVYPPWYGYLAMMIPYSIWQILFSPFGQRPVIVSLMCVCLVLQAMEKDNRMKRRR